MWVVRALTIFHVRLEWEVEDKNMARECAKRIITEGLWYIKNNGTEVFLPVHQVQKVKVYKKDMLR